jgi:hypothetical protein
MDVYFVCVLYSKGTKQNAEKFRQRKNYGQSTKGEENKKIPLGASLSASVQTGSEVHPAQWVKCLPSGAKRPELGVIHPPHLSPRLKK